MLILASATVAAAQERPWLERLAGPTAAASLSAGNAETRRAAARRLGTRGAAAPAVEALARALQGERDVDVRSEIVRSLGLRGGAPAEEALVEAFRESDLATANAVARTLGAFRTPAAIGALVDGLADPRLLGPARQGLLRAGRAAVPALLTASSSAELRHVAIELLGALRDRRATPVVVEALRDQRAEVCLVALRAVAEIADDRASPMVLRLLSEGPEDAELRAAALDALGAVGAPEHASAVRAALDDPEFATRRAALEALVRLDPPAGVARMEQAVASREDVLGPAAVELALGSHDPSVASILYGIVEEGSRAPEAISALAELDGGAGLPVLLELAPQDSSVGEHARRGLAIALRKWGGDDLRGRALTILREARQLTLRAIARDRTALDEVLRDLEGDPEGRRAAAEGLIALHSGSTEAGGEASGALRAALERETDPEAYQALVRAALVARVRVPTWIAWRWLDDPRTTAAALLLAGWSVRGRLEHHEGRRIRRSIRRSLRTGSVRVRAAAAHALAWAGDQTGWRALVSAVDDPALEVRLAASHALKSLGAGEAVTAVRARARVEADARVALALVDAATPRRRRPRPWEPLGSEVLRVRVVPQGARGAEVPVDLVLPNGMWIQTRTDARGEVLAVDLPSDAVDVRIGP